MTVSKEVVSLSQKFILLIKSLSVKFKGAIVFKHHCDLSFKLTGTVSTDGTRIKVCTGASTKNIPAQNSK